MALTWASTDVSNHINFIPDEKMYLLNILHEAALKKKSPDPILNSSYVVSEIFPSANLKIVMYRIEVIWEFHTQGDIQTNNQNRNKGNKMWYSW